MFSDKTTLCPKNEKEAAGLILNVLKLESRLVKPQKPRWLCIICHRLRNKVMLVPKKVPDDSQLAGFQLSACTHKKEQFYQCLRFK